MKSESRIWHINCDGLCEPNPGGIATYGWIAREGGRVLDQGCGLVAMGAGATNNVAEYRALIAALQWLDRQELPAALTVIIEMDSQLVVNQVMGHWAVKKAELMDLCQEVTRLLKRLQSRCQVHLGWVSREYNEAADALSRQVYEAVKREQESKAEALRRARSAGLPIEDAEDGTFFVRSQSTPDLAYQVEPKTPWCTCPDFQRRKRPCKHIFAVQQHLQSAVDG